MDLGGAALGSFVALSLRYTRAIKRFHFTTSVYCTLCNVSQRVHEGIIVPHSTFATLTKTEAFGFSE
jgi:hypothetical protein